MRYLTYWGLVSLVILGVAPACDSPPTEPADPDLPSGIGLRQSASQVPVREDVMEQKLKEITRAFSIALQNDERRALVYQSLEDSPFREGKRHFRTMLSSEWAPLLSDIAALSTSTVGAVEAALDSIVDLEVYLPVPEHRKLWKGGKDLIVAFAISDHGEAPVGFVVGGERVELSAATAPSTPTLILTRVETNFTPAPPNYVNTPFGIGARPLTTSGVWMTGLYVEEEWEAWWQGSPEFEVHAFAQNGSTGKVEDVACAGEARSGESYFNYDDAGTWWWQGNALVASETDLSTADSLVAFTLWERDSGAACEDDGGGRPPKTTAGGASEINAQDRDILWEARNPPSPITLWGVVVGALEAVFTLVTSDPDDYVGTFMFPPVGCWPTATGSVNAPVYGLTGWVGNSYLDNNFGVRQPICLTVSISGPGTISSSGNYQWTATASGGQGGYTYEWYSKVDHYWPRTGATCHYQTEYQLVGTGSSYVSYVSVNDFDFRLLVVASSGGMGATESKHVLVGSGGPCPE